MEQAAETVENRSMGNSVFEWALKKYGKTMPKKEEHKEEMQIAMPVFQPNASTPVIDPDQMARIMKAFGHLNETVDRIPEKLDALIDLIKILIEKTDANADVSYKLLKDTKGAMEEGLRKARRAI